MTGEPPEQGEPSQPPPAGPPPGWPGPPPTGWSGPPPPGYPAPGPYGYGYPYPRQTEGNAIAALVCAVASFVVCPVVPAIVALALAPAAERNIAASGGTKEGEGLVKAARIIAWVNIGLAVLGIVVLLIVVATVSNGTGP